MDAEEWEEIKARPRPRRWPRVVVTVVTAFTLGYLVLLGFALQSLNCDGGLLGVSQCSGLERFGYIALSFTSLLGLPFTLWLIWRQR